MEFIICTGKMIFSYINLFNSQNPSNILLHPDIILNKWEIRKKLNNLKCRSQITLFLFESQIEEYNRNLYYSDVNLLPSVLIHIVCQNGRLSIKIKTEKPAVRSDYRIL